MPYTDFANAAEEEAAGAISKSHPPTVCPGGEHWVAGGGKKKCVLRASSEVAITLQGEVTALYCSSSNFLRCSYFGLGPVVGMGYYFLIPWQEIDSVIVLKTDVSFSHP